MATGCTQLLRIQHNTCMHHVGLMSAFLCSVRACPYVLGLPPELGAWVGQRALESKRHFALNMVRNFADHHARGPPWNRILYVDDIRPRDFCCYCDSDAHQCAHSVSPLPAY